MTPHWRLASTSSAWFAKKYEPIELHFMSDTRANFFRLCDKDALLG